MMTQKLDNGIVVIQEEEANQCAFCGEQKELRPYGPNRERICFDCAMKDEATTARIFTRDVLGEGETH